MEQYHFYEQPRSNCYPERFDCKFWQILLKSLSVSHAQGFLPLSWLGINDGIQSDQMDDTSRDN